MLFISRTCFNEFLSLLDVTWVNKVLLLLLFDGKKLLGYTQRFISVESAVEKTLSALENLD